MRFSRLQLTEANNATNNFVKICQSLSAIYKTERNQGRADYSLSSPLLSSPSPSPRPEIAARIKTLPLPLPLSFPSNMIENSGGEVTLDWCSKQLYLSTQGEKERGLHPLLHDYFHGEKNPSSL